VTDPAELARRLLRQRRDLGENQLFLEDATAQSLVEALRAARLAPAREPALPPPAARAPLPKASPPAEAVAAGATAPGPSAGELVRIGDLDALRELALGCPRCRLSATRKRVVFGEGDPRAEVVVVGEAPGADEDRVGRPFVGRAGRLLDQLLLSAGFTRETVFICNVLKCRPPGNRNPQPDEIAACNPYLTRQLELIGPRAIFALGAFAAQTLLNTSVPISRLRGTIHTYGDVPVIPTYHPAALLRNPAWVRVVWEDLQRLRSVLSA
jgi:uracil-DNA glycosylase